MEKGLDSAVTWYRWKTIFNQKHLQTVHRYSMRKVQTWSSPVLEVTDCHIHQSDTEEVEALCDLHGQCGLRQDVQEFLRLLGVSVRKIKVRGTTSYLVYLTQQDDAGSQLCDWICARWFKTGGGELSWPIRIISCSHTQSNTAAAGKAGRKDDQ